MTRTAAALMLLLALLGLAGCGTSGSDAGEIDGAPGAGIFGRLVDENSTAVAGAQVTIETTAGEVLAGPVTTDANGEFELSFPTDTPPADANLHVRPPQRPESMVPLQLPESAQVAVVVQLGPGGAALVTVLLPPDNAQPFDLHGRQAYLVPIESGRSRPFRVAVRGGFDPARADLRLAYRLPGGPWRLSGPGTPGNGSTAIRLNLGVGAGELHGLRLEVRALAAPPGRLDGVTSFQRPEELGAGVFLSPDALPVVPVAPNGAAATAGVLTPAAVWVPGEPSTFVDVSAQTLEQLGLNDGELVVLTGPANSVTLTTRVSNLPLLRLATAVIPRAEALTLGLDLDDQFAGYRVLIERSRPDP